MELTARLAPVATLKVVPVATETGPPSVDVPAPILSEPWTTFRVASEFVVKLNTESD